MRSISLAGLLTGNAPLVRQVLTNYLRTFPFAERAAQLKRFAAKRARFSTHQTWRQRFGASYRRLLEMDKSNLPADEAAQIKRLADTYARTADNAGFSVRIPQ